MIRRRTEKEKYELLFINLRLLAIKLQLAQAAIANKKINVPSTLFEEKAVNPYLRVNERYYKDLMKEEDGLKVFGKLKKIEEMIKNPKV